MLDMKKKILIPLMCAALTGVPLMQGRSAEFKESDYSELAPEEGFFGELGYRSCFLPAADVFKNEIIQTDKKFGSGSVVLNTGYQSKIGNANITLGIAGYTQYRSTDVAGALKGSGIMLALHLEYRDIPMIDYAYSWGASSTGVKMGFSTLSITLYPKMIQVEWPQNIWFRKVSIFPGLSFERNWLSIGEIDSSYDPVTSGTDAEGNPIPVVDKDTIDDVMIALRFDIALYTRTSIDGSLKYGFNGTVKGSLGIKYLFWGPWMETSKKPEEPSLPEEPQ